MRLRAERGGGQERFPPECSCPRVRYTAEQLSLTVEAQKRCVCMCACVCAHACMREREGRSFT